MASARDFPDVIREGDPLPGNAYRHSYGGSYYLLLFPDWPQGYRRDGEAAVYLEDKEKGEHRRVRNETLSEAVRRDYWRKIDYANAHPMTDGPGPGFLKDLREYAEKNPTPPYIPFGGADVFLRFPDVVPASDPFMDHSYGHWYGETYYYLVFPDWPQGYRKDVQPAAYTLDKEKGEYRRLADALLSVKIAEHFWREIDEENLRMLNPQPRPFRMGDANPAQTGFSGMMDGPGMLAPQFRKALEDSMKKGHAAQAPKSAASWTCPGCGGTGNTGRFCPECGAPKPENPEGWICPSCGAEGNRGNFCAECGTRRPG